MKISYENIGESNRKEALNLHVKKSQVGTIETVEECLEEADQLSLWRPVIIKIDDVAVAFAMYGLWVDEGSEGRLWLDRYFIDENYQGRGYGKIILEDLVNKLKTEYPVDKCYLSVYDTNLPAINLYKKLGFVFNGEKDINGELVMVKKMKEN